MHSVRRAALLVQVIATVGCTGTPREPSPHDVPHSQPQRATAVAADAAAAVTATAFDEEPADCRVWGVTPSRNMVSPGRNPPVTWDVETGANILWTAKLGSKAYGEPIVADGVVYVGTNNEAAYDKRHTNADGAIDGGVLMAFDAETGAFLWQRYSAKLASGRVNDWPGEGVCSAVFVERGRLWYATNRCEVVCLDVSAGRNQRSEPKVTWSFDMMKELGVFPHNMTRSHIVAYKDLIYVVTGNGVDDTHKHIPAPAAPSLVCFDKVTGKVVWSDASPGANILHGTWGIISLAEVNGKALVIAPQGDGWVRAFEAETGKKIWWFDTNPKASVYPQTRNELLSAAAIVGNRMYIGNGQDPEHGTGSGHFWCVRIDGAGDVGAELAADLPAPGEDWFALVNAGQAPRKRAGVRNPDSAVIWHYDRAGGAKKTPEVDRMHRTMSTAAVYKGLVFIPDFSGYVHCFDAGSGRKCWSVDLESPDIWAAPLIIDGKLYIGDGSGTVHVFAAAEEMKKLATNPMGSAVYTTPTYANHTLYLMSMHKLYAIREASKGDSPKGK